MKRRKINKIGILILALLSIILISGISLTVIHFKNKTEVNIIAEKKTYNLKISYPILHDKKVDKEIKEYVNKNKEEFMETVKADKNKDAKYEFMVQYKITTYKDIKNIRLITHKFVGGKNYEQLDKTINYDINDKKVVTLGHYFKNSDYLNTLSSLAYYYVMDYGAVNQKNFEEPLVIQGTLPKIENFQNFTFTKDGLKITFSPYQVVNNGEGEVAITVPYEQINDILKKKYKGESKVKEDKQTVLTTDKRDINNYKGKKLMAITFDDGPGKSSTNYLLDELKKRDSRVTFFVLGSRVEQYPAVLQREYTEGHEIGNHTYNHKNLFHLNNYEIIKETNETNLLIKRNTGFMPTLLRPPYGNINDNIKSLTNMNTILWDVDTLDWKLKDKNKIANVIVRNAHDGAIVLLHDIYKNSVEGAIMAINTLKNQGYEFVTISEMAEIKGTVLEKNKNYFNF